MRRSTVLGLLGAAGAAALGPPARAADLVRISAIPIEGGAQAAYADAQGYFRDAGITLAAQYTTNGAAIAAAVSGGAVDVGYTNVLTLASAHERGVPFTIIAPAGSYVSRAPVTLLITAADAPYKTAKDLDGKTIAVNGLRNITQLAVEAWSDAGGGDRRSLKFVELPFPAMATALEQHRVDAAICSEPSLSDALRAGTVKSIGKPYDAIAPEFTISLWFVNRSWSVANPALVKRFAGAIRKASVWANAHDAQSAPIVAEMAKLPLATVTRMPRSRFPESLDGAQFQPVIDRAARLGFLTKAFPAAEMIDPDAGYV